MVLVEVSFDDRKVSLELLQTMVRVLPHLVVKALEVSVDDPRRFNKTPRVDDIEIAVRSFGEFDVHQKDFEVIVTANHYSEREESLRDRREVIRQELVHYLQGASHSVWLRLVSGSYGSS